MRFDPDHQLHLPMGYYLLTYSVMAPMTTASRLITLARDLSPTVGPVRDWDIKDLT